MVRECRIGNCRSEVLSELAADGVCLDHFVDLVIRRADQVRAQCLESEPVDEETLDWLLSDAPHAAQALAGAGADSLAQNERLLELLLCLSNLQDYVSHHSLRLKPSR